MEKVFFGLFLLIVFAKTNICTAQTHVVGALKTYRYWAGEDPDGTKKVLNGEYWTYGHFTKEYTMYLEVKIKPALAKIFITDNNLKRGKYKKLSGAPKWFKPPKNYEVWEGTQGSTYFISTSTGHIFMYEVQL